VNGEPRQNSDIDQMIWSVPEQIAFLNAVLRLEAAISHDGHHRPAWAPPSRAMSFSRE